MTQATREQLFDAKERTADGRVKTRSSTIGYTAQCCDRDAGVWGVYAAHCGERQVFTVYPEPGVMCELRARWLAETLTKLERGRS